MALSFRARCVALPLLLVACEPSGGVSWVDPAPVATTHPSPLDGVVVIDSLLGDMALADTALSDTASLARFHHEQALLREAGARSLVASVLDTVADAQGDESKLLSAIPADSGDAPAGRGEFPLDDRRCPTSLRLAQAQGRGTVAVWWSRRDRGRVALVASWRFGEEGAPWRAPVVVDSLDRGPSDAQEMASGLAGCARPAPGVAVSQGNGYAHVAYALRGPEGAGVFYAHQMDPRSQFETPVVMVYGDGIGEAQVAAAGDIVAVAYQDPNNRTREQISLAVSRTAGHSFEPRMVASGNSANARDPYVVVRGNAIALGWSETRSDSGRVFTVRRAAVR